MEKLFSEKQKDTREFYEKSALSYKLRTDSNDLSSHYAWLFNHIDKTRTLKILDLGCGPGRDTRFFLGKGYDVVSMDASKSMVELTKEINPQTVLSNIEDLDFT